MAINLKGTQELARSALALYRFNIYYLSFSEVLIQKPTGNSKMLQNLAATKAKFESRNKLRIEKSSSGRGKEVTGTT